MIFMFYGYVECLLRVKFAVNDEKNEKVEVLSSIFMKINFLHFTSYHKYYTISQK